MDDGEGFATEAELIATEKQDRRRWKDAQAAWDAYLEPILDEREQAARLIELAAEASAQPRSCVR